MYKDINLVCSLGCINYKGNNASVRVYKYINSYEVVILTDDGFTLYSKMFTTSYPSNINDAIKHAENLVR